MLPNKLETGAGADDEGADAPVDSAEEAGALSCGFAGLAKSEGAFVEGTVVPELAGLFRKLNPPDVAAGDAVDFAVEASGCVDLARLNRDGAVCAEDADVEA